MLASSPGPGPPKNLEGPGDEATELHGSSSRVFTTPIQQAVYNGMIGISFPHGTAWERDQLQKPRPFN